MSGRDLVAPRGLAGTRRVRLSEDRQLFRAPGIPDQHAVLEDKDFNAACFPGGQFIIHVGTFQSLYRIIAAQVGKPASRPLPARGTL